MINGADIGAVRPLRDFAGAGFKRRLLANLQHLARRSVLHIKCSLHFILRIAMKKGRKSSH
jgi:hypothetical protein